jgi:hypothetical protein
MTGSRRDISVRDSDERGALAPRYRDKFYDSNPLPSYFTFSKQDAQCSKA